MNEAEDLRTCQIEVLEFIEKFTDDTVWGKKIKKTMNAASILTQFDALEEKLESAQHLMLWAITIATHDNVKKIGEIQEKHREKLDEMNNQLMMKLNELLSKDSTDYAAKGYRNCILQKQASVELSNAAQAMVAGDKHAEERELRKVIEKNPKSQIAWFNLGFLLMDHKKDYDGAEAAYRKALAIDPIYADAWINLGILLQDHKKNYDGAEAAYREALAIDPKDVLAWYNLGVLLYYNQEDVDGAEDAYRNALAIDPKHVNAWINLAVLLKNHKKDFDGAEVAYKKALAIDPKDAVVVQFGKSTT